MVLHSNLHARKKHTVTDEEALTHPSNNHSPKDSPPSDDDEDHTHNTRKRRRKYFSWTAETECAASAVALYLAIALFLAYFLMHHQHRKVALHVIRHPWAHGGAVFRRKRAGFHHHFYSGSPRFVTAVRKYFLIFSCVGCTPLCHVL